MKKKLKLHGFNNLTSSLSFNIYDVCYAKTRADKREYLHYIHNAYNAEKLTSILSDVANIIDANILNIATQDYEPQGSSVTMMIAEGASQAPCTNTETPGPLPETVLAHLDKSHITVHTYPESHPDDGICTFRADIDVSTCGVISPLKALNYLIHSFDSDIVTIDYRIRGFTRDTDGTKHFMDHDINSIQNYFATETHIDYHMIDVNVYQENIFHTKMLLKQFDLDNYLFGQGKEGLTQEEHARISKQVRHEMLEIFYGRNMQHIPDDIKAFTVNHNQRIVETADENI